MELLLPKKETDVFTTVVTGKENTTKVVIDRFISIQIEPLIPSNKYYIHFERCDTIKKLKKQIEGLKDKIFIVQSFETYGYDEDINKVYNLQKHYSQIPDFNINIIPIINGSINLVKRRAEKMGFLEVVSKNGSHFYLMFKVKYYGLSCLRGEDINKIKFYSCLAAPYMKY
jgi:hypothetical protein